MLEQAKSVNTVRGVLYSLDTEKNRDLTQEEIDFSPNLNHARYHEAL